MAEDNKNEWFEEPTKGSTAPDPAVDTMAEEQTENWGGPAENSSSSLLIQQHSGQFNAAQAKILIYGESGTEKTRLASTFPNIILADTDNGLSSVDRQIDSVAIGRLTVLDEENPDKEPPDPMQQMKDLLSFLRAGDHGYETVVIDTLNELQKMAMGNVLGKYKMKRFYGDLPTMGDYGKMLNDFLGLVRDFIALPMRVVLIAQVTSQQFDTDVLQPQLTGKNTAREIARKMDIIGYTYKQMQDGESVPMIGFDSPGYVTKDRSGKLPAVLERPTYEAIAQYWEVSKKKK